MNKRLTIAIALSIVAHGVAYAALLHIRPSMEKKQREWDVYKQKEKKKKVEFKPKKKEKPREEPRKPRPRPPRRPPARPPRRPPPRTRAEPPPRVLDLTKTGLSENSFGGDGIAMPIGDTTLGDPDIEPPRPPRITTPKPQPRPEPRPKPKPRVTVKTLPKPVNVPVLPYPASARNRGIQGTIVLEVTIGKDGKVQKAKVIKGLGHGLDETAKRALMKARFKPAVGSDGKPMTYKIRYRYTFRLEESDGF